MDKPVKVTMGMISEIMGLSKDGQDPSQYFHGKDNEKKLVATLMNRYALECDGRA